MPLLVDFDGLEAKPTPTRARARSAVPLHPGQVAGINRNRWPISAGLGGRFPPDQVADFDRNAQSCPRISDFRLVVENVPTHCKRLNRDELCPQIPEDQEELVRR